jgi:hypothetical protein
MSYIKANKNTEQRTVIQMYRLQHAQANKSCDYNDDSTEPYYLNIYGILLVGSHLDPEDTPYLLLLFALFISTGAVLFLVRKLRFVFLK